MCCKIILPSFFSSFLPESPRWLLAKGRYKKAYDVMAKIATVNGKPVPHDLMEQLVALNQQKEKIRRSSSVGSAVRSKRVSSTVNKELFHQDALEVSQEGSFTDILRYPGRSF